MSMFRACLSAWIFTCSRRVDWKRKSGGRTVISRGSLIMSTIWELPPDTSSIVLLYSVKALSTALNEMGSMWIVGRGRLPDQPWISSWDTQIEAVSRFMYCQDAGPEMIKWCVGAWMITQMPIPFLRQGHRRILPISSSGIIFSATCLSSCIVSYLVYFARLKRPKNFQWCISHSSHDSTETTGRDMGNYQ